MRSAKLAARGVKQCAVGDDHRTVSVAAVGSSPCPPLESSWQRSERECAARQRGDVYYQLNEVRSQQPSPSTTDETANLSTGFTLRL